MLQNSNLTKMDVVILPETTSTMLMKIITMISKYEAVMPVLRNLQITTIAMTIVTSDCDRIDPCQRFHEVSR